jgi:flavin reductase (DIM6/NTAB) family NADH-FMN oxidoreductase RutF
VSLPPDLFRRACGHFATGIAVLTTCDAEGRPHGMTINSFASLSLDPPLVMASIAKANNLLGVFEHAPNFAINILSCDQQDISDRFARRKDDRFGGIEWRASGCGAPSIPGALATIECRTTDIIDAGDHRVLIGHVECATCSADDARPLLYFRGRYAGIE